MSEVPEGLRFTSSHEWVRAESDGTVTVGITDHAQELLGDLVFVELPEVGRGVGSGEECGVVESVKAASDVYSPLAGEITAVNEALTNAPELVNQSPFADGWLFRLRPADSAALDKLLDAKAYQAQLDDEA